MLTTQTNRSRPARQARIRGATIGVALLLTLVSCSDDVDDPDPGPRPDEPTGSGSSPSESDSPEVAELPVAASFVVDADDEGRQVRFALHGLRRVDGGTVVDYSVTGLPSDSVAEGEPLGSGVELDFEGFTNAPNVNLIDVPSAKVYRPLADESGICVCTFVSKLGLVAGTTELHQAAYPELPAGLTEVTVEFGNGPLVGAVPVLDVGEVPTGEAEDLAAPAEELPVLASTDTFRQPVKAVVPDPQPQPLTIDVNRVLSGPGGTSLVWTINGAGEGAGLSTAGTPLSDYRLASVSVAIKTGVGSGPGIRSTEDPDGAVLRSWFSTLRAKAGNQFTDVTPEDWRFCLCTDYQSFGDGVDSAQKSRTFVSHLPPLAEGTSTVDVIFPDDSLPTLSDVPVETAMTSALGEPETGESQTWTLPEGTNNREAFEVTEWPTPVPDTASLALVEPIVDELLDKQTLPNAEREKKEEKVEITLDGTVTFEPDSARLTSAARAGIAAIADQINTDAAPGSEIMIGGHVAGSDQGSEAVQLRLSTDRADAVLAALRPMIDADVTLTAEGFGATQPVAPNDTEANRILNRRVVVTFTTNE